MRDKKTVLVLKSKSGSWTVCCTSDHAADWAQERRDLGPRRLGFTALDTCKDFVACMHCAFCGFVAVEPAVRCALHITDCPPYFFEASLVAFYFPMVWTDMTSCAELTEEVWSEAAAIAEDFQGILTASEIVRQIVAH